MDRVEEVKRATRYLQRKKTERERKYYLRASIVSLAASFALSIWLILYLIGGR
jgi:hypothetical protein